MRPLDLILLIACFSPKKIERVRSPDPLGVTRSLRYRIATVGRASARIKITN